LPLLPIGAFLAGALLTLLLPVGLLIALAVWYWGFSVRAPETRVGHDPGPEPSSTNPGPAIPETLPPDPAA
jgi:hypothetical protein